MGIFDNMINGLHDDTRSNEEKNRSAFLDGEFDDLDDLDDDSEFDGPGQDEPLDKADDWTDESSGDDFREEDKFNENAESKNENRQDELVKGREVGIDLGTTNSVVACIDRSGTARVVKVKGSPLIPSYIYFETRNKVYYGNEAKRRAKSRHSGGAVSLFKKRLLAYSKPFRLRVPKDDTAETDGRYYIIDTNVFLDWPEILRSFPEDAVIVLPVTVEQELEFRAMESGTKYSAEKAMEEIVDFRTHAKERLILAESDLSLLGEDFFHRFREGGHNANNDNRILTIAMQYRDRNATLISSDRQLVRLKAEFAGVRGLTLQEFQMQRSDTSSRFEEWELTGVEATTMFLGYLKTEAEKAFQEPVTKAVITVPATFNLVEIENTKRAGLQAGFTEVHIEKEPTAAAIAYNIDGKKQASTFVYDFGGGTFDVSVIRSDGKGGFDVLGTDGNSKLGGEDLTQCVEEYIYDYLEEHYELSMYEEDGSGLSPEQYVYNRERIYWAAENCKMELSAMESTTINLLDLYIQDGKQQSVLLDITRQTFEDLIKPTLNRTIAAMNNGLSKAELMKKDIDNVIVAGGSSLIPCVQKQVENYFGYKPSADKNAATLIAEGAAIVANGLYGEDHLIKMRPQVYDKTFEDFGVALEKWEYSCIIPAGTTLPASAEKVYSLVEDGQSQLNIKVFSRKSEAQNARKTFDAGVEYLDELSMSNIPPLRMEEADVVVKFEITKQYELRTDVVLKKKDGTVIDKGNLSIDRQSMQS